MADESHADGAEICDLILRKMSRSISQSSHLCECLLRSDCD